MRARGDARRRPVGRPLCGAVTPPHATTYEPRELDHSSRPPLRAGRHHPRYAGKGDIPALGDDPLLGAHRPRLLRRLQLLHHLGPSGQVRHLAQRAVDPRRGGARRADAGLQGVSLRRRRPRRPTCTAWAGATGGSARRCRRASCLHPKRCPNLDNDHRPLLALY